MSALCKVQMLDSPVPICYYSLAKNFRRIEMASNNIAEPLKIKTISVQSIPMKHCTEYGN